MKNCHYLFIAALLVLSLLTPHAGNAQGKIYFVESGSDKIRRANLDGTSLQDLLTFISPHFLAFDLRVSEQQGSGG